MSAPNVSDILNKALELADRHPEAIYQRHGSHCSYTTGDVLENGVALPRQGCIVGQAIHELLGDYPANLLDYDLEGVEALVSWGVIYEESAIAFKALEALQSNQDQGEPWGNAARTVRKYLADHEVTV